VSKSTDKDFVVSDTYLKDFANNKIAAFLADYGANPDIRSLGEFAAATGGGYLPGEYSSLLGGTGQLTIAAELQTRFKDFCSSLLQQLQSLQSTMHKTSGDLLAVDSILAKAADAANLTASEMNQDLQDILNLTSTVPPAST
jgi:hypothetical protein